jgi:hypothetical protein
MYCTCVRFVVAVTFALDKRYSFLIYMKIVYISATGELYATYYVTSGTTNYVILLPKYIRESKTSSKQN